MKKPTPNQHYRLSLEKAKQDYRDGILTATGLVYYAIGIYRAPGQKLRVADIDEFCAHLGINRATFYRAISKLKTKNRIDWEGVGGVDVWIVNPSVTQLHAGQEVSQLCESQSQDCKTQLQGCETESQDCKTQLQGCETESRGCDKDPLELPFCKGSGNSSDNISDIYQIFLNSLSKSESERFLEFCQSQQKPQDWIEEHHVVLWHQFQEEFCVEQKNPGLDQSSAPPKNQTEEELAHAVFEKFNAGEITHIPDGELRRIAQWVITADVVSAYRKSGRFMNAAPNDLLPAFVAYILHRDNQEHPSYVARLINRVERDPRRWGELIALVEEFTCSGQHPIKQASQKAAISQQAAIYLSYLDKK